ncbi:MAG: hypothetical protein H0X34_01110 [Chthoniobacterales bacterium]|jgi:hypothetical protein|nr:hypothetical protein [Chthoniobacterales bacterium]
MLQIGDSLARLSLGMPVNRSEITGRDGAPLNPVAAPVIQIRYLSDAESRKLIEEARPRLPEEDR